MITIPLVPSKANYRVGVPIGNVADAPLPVYLFDVRWNSRADTFYLDLLEIDERPIVVGMRLVLGVWLGRQTVHPLFSHGIFVLTDLTRQGKEAGYDDLGTRVVLRYFSDADVAVGVMGRLAGLGKSP